MIMNISNNELPHQYMPIANVMSDKNMMVLAMMQLVLNWITICL